MEFGADEGLWNQGGYILTVFKAFSKSQLIEIVKSSVRKLESPECGAVFCKPWRICNAYAVSSWEIGYCIPPYNAGRLGFYIKGYPLPGFPNTLEVPDDGIFSGEWPRLAPPNIKSN